MRGWNGLRNLSTRLQDFIVDTNKGVLRNVNEIDIINKNNDYGAVGVHFVGKIDKKIYSCITDDIVTDDVIITDVQIQHIKDRHPNDFERFRIYFSEIIQNPDFIIKANKPYSALVLKEVKDTNNELFKMIIRLVTSVDNADYKNSIITFMKIDNKEWNRLLRNKMVLYRRNK